MPTTVVRCSTCHGVYARPFLVPTGNPYALHDEGEYFHLIDSNTKQELGKTLARAAEDHTGSPGRLLELGCGTGQLLVGARAAGWSAHGVEMTEAFAHQAREAGVDVETASVEACRSLDRQWECIVLAAVLEHLYDPRSCLARVHRALVPGGVAYIDVPNECSLWSRVGNAYMRLRGRGWAVNLSPTFPPYHVVGFCPRSLRWLVADCGLEMVELHTHRWLNALPRPETPVARIEAFAADIALSIGAKLGSGAGITAWVRKPQRNV
jgi:SAM-dependent methyltransferase